MDDPRYEKYRSVVEDVGEKLGLRRLPPATLAALVIGVLALIGYGCWSWSSAGVVKQSTAVSVVDTAGADPAEAAEVAGAATIVVHVVGAVKQPGVYELPCSARGIDAVEAAGGLKDNAAPGAVNLAAPLEDGAQLCILTRKQAKAQQAGASGGETSLPGATQAGGLVDLNTADITLLQTLPGIGPVTAEKIVNDRTANGAYGSLEELTRVSGIGEKRVEALRGLAEAKR